MGTRQVGCSSVGRDSGRRQGKQLRIQTDTINKCKVEISD